MNRSDTNLDNGDGRIVVMLDAEGNRLSVRHHAGRRTYTIRNAPSLTNRRTHIGVMISGMEPNGPSLPEPIYVFDARTINESQK